MLCRAVLPGVIAALAAYVYWHSRTSSSSPPRVEMPDSSSSLRTRFYLFGSPISHSLSPTFHNALFDSLDLPHRYELYETPTFSTDESIVSLLRSDPTFAGAAVTMPHKVDALSLMDSVGREVEEIGSMNTIVVDKGGNLVGRNTDVLGIRNALLASLRAEGGDVAGAAEGYEFGRGRSAMIIGGGGTTRAAVYALSQMGLSPLYLVNRDAAETASIISSFPQYDLRPLDDEDACTDRDAETVVCAVGAIPSVEPVSDGEKRVYTIVDKVFRTSRTKSNGPRRRILDMAYKPHVTRIIELARSHDWITIGGIEALVHQAFAQDKYWLLDPEISTYLAHLDPAVDGPEQGERQTRLDDAWVKASGEVRQRAGALVFE